MILFTTTIRDVVNAAVELLMLDLVTSVDTVEADMILLLLLLLLLMLVLVMTALPPPSLVRITGILCAVFASNIDGDVVGAEVVNLVEDSAEIFTTEDDNSIGDEFNGVLAMVDESVLCECIMLVAVL